MCFISSPFPQLIYKMDKLFKQVTELKEKVGPINGTEAKQGIGNDLETRLTTYRKPMVDTFLGVKREYMFPLEDLDQIICEQECHKLGVDIKEVEREVERLEEEKKRRTLNIPIIKGILKYLPFGRERMLTKDIKNRALQKLKYQNAVNYMDRYFTYPVYVLFGSIPYSTYAYTDGDVRSVKSYESVMYDCRHERCCHNWCSDTEKSSICKDCLGIVQFAWLKPSDDQMGRYLYCMGKIARLGNANVFGSQRLKVMMERYINRETDDFDISGMVFVNKRKFMDPYTMGSDRTCHGTKAYKYGICGDCFGFMPGRYVVEPQRLIRYFWVMGILSERDPRWVKYLGNGLTNKMQMFVLTGEGLRGTRIELCTVDPRIEIRRQLAEAKK